MSVGKCLCFWCRTDQQRVAVRFSIHNHHLARNLMKRPGRADCVNDFAGVPTPCQKALGQFGDYDLFTGTDGD